SPPASVSLSRGSRQRFAGLGTLLASAAGSTSACLHPNFVIQDQDLIQAVLVGPGAERVAGVKEFPALRNDLGNALQLARSSQRFARAKSPQLPAVFKTTAVEPGTNKISDAAQRTFHCNAGVHPDAAPSLRQNTVKCRA